MEGLAELHTHLGGSVASDILWSLAHEQGIALPVKDFWEFDRLVTVSDPRGVANLDALDQIYHWTELIQSSPIAVERSVHAAIGGAYRSQGITKLEVRLHQLKRKRGDRRCRDNPCRRRGRRHGPRGDRRGRGSATPGPDRPRDPGRRRPGPDGRAARCGDRAGDLPNVEPAD